MKSTNACPGNSSQGGNGSNDVVYAFTPSTTASYPVTLAGSGFDTTLYMATDCADIDNTCIGADDQACSSCDETVTATLTAGTTYYILVDGWSNSSNTYGTYQLDIATP